jgi:lysyl endopeptidase
MKFFQGASVRKHDLFQAAIAAAGLGLFMLGFAEPAFAQSSSSAIAPYPAKAEAVQTLRMPAGAVPATVLRFAAVESAEIDAVRQANALGTLKRLQIGIGRGAGDRPEANDAALRWTPVEGGVVAHWQVISPEARALRVGLAAARMAPGTEIRFAGSAQMERVYGPFSAADVKPGTGTYWSPVLEGDSATVEIFVALGASPADVSLAIAQVSHLFASPAHGAVEKQAKASEFCEVDLICRSASDAALASVGRAVARMTYSDGSSANTFLCTGTLLNPASGPLTAYFYSAHHCISTQAAASTLTTHWFYESAGCGTSALSSSYVQVPGGATLLYADQPSDSLLLRLNNPPPGGATYAAWDASPLANGTALTAVHHPAGDLKKVSLGTMGGFGPYPGRSASFIIARWNAIATGVTEGGSSGSGIFTGSASTEYKLRGGLLGGQSSCTASAAELVDYYSRLDRVYPAIAAYLNPAAANYTSMYWNSQESGWGFNVNHQGDTIFATLFTYDAAGNPMWLVLANGARQGAGSTFAGDLYRTTGSPFNVVPYVPSAASDVVAVGTMTVTFSGTGNAALSYSVNGVPVTKAITKQIFGARAAGCVGTTESRGSAENYTDMWWNSAESGWGINMTQQGDVIFATLFTYAANRQGMWYVLANGAKQPDGSYLGDLFRTTGSAFNAVPFVPLGASNVVAVGTLRVRFTSGTTAILDYSIDGVSVTKSIIRQVFSSPLPLCS